MSVIARIQALHFGLTANRVIGLLTTIFVVLQFQLWFSSSGYAQTRILNTKIVAQEAVNAKLAGRNRLVVTEINDLKHGSSAIEERARYELGMVKPGEVYYQLT